MGKAAVVEPAVPDEEVFLEVFHHPFHLTFAYGPSWTAGPWQEAVVIGQQQERTEVTPPSRCYFSALRLSGYQQTSTVFTLPPK